MPGRNPAEAVREYIEPIQQSLSCITNRVIRPSGYDVDNVHALTFNEAVVDVITTSDEVLHLTFAQTFSIERTLVLRNFKVRTRSYAYAIENDYHREIIAYHWHPESVSDVTFTHLHIGDGAGDHIRDEVRSMHFRTDRMALEEFIMILINDFRVIPERNDHMPILQANLDKFRRHRSWVTFH